MSTPNAVPNAAPNAIAAQTASTITTPDGAQIYYKDWGTGPVVMFSHGWPLNADSWEAQMLFLANKGFRCIAHDRRGHGRSTQTWHGNEMDTYADDLSALITALDLADGPFFGANRPGQNPSRGMREAFWLQGLQSGHRNAYECIAAFSATDFRHDLDAIDVPALVIHGDDDQVVPFAVGGKASAERIRNAQLIVYPGAPHGITDTHKDQLSNDLLTFLHA